MRWNHQAKQTPETIAEVLVRLSKTNTSNESDGETIQFLLHKIGFKNAVVTCGIVYVTGTGNGQPNSIHDIAKVFIEELDKKGIVIEGQKQ